MNDALQRTLRLSLYRLSALYFGALLLAVVIAVYLNIAHHQRLAESFSKAANNSLVIRDLRQTITILAPAVGESFTSVSFTSNEGTSLFTLPSKLLAGRPNGLFTSSIDIPVHSSASTYEKPLGRLNYRFNWTEPVIPILGIWAMLLTLAIPTFRRMRTNLVQRHREVLKAQESEIILNVVRQVSHDIRSPLSTINMVIKTISDIPDEKRTLIQAATKRINGIANDLLARYKHSGESSSQFQSMSSNGQLETDKKVHIKVPLLLKEIVAEKQAMLLDQPSLRIKLDVRTTTDAVCLLDEKEFCRTVSNLINNSAEALHGATEEEITVSLREVGKNEVAVIISDNGKGIHEDILEKLGKVQITTGKEGTESGSGIGVFHAARAIESMGGRFRIQSKVGYGTIVTMTFPRVI